MKVRKLLALLAGTFLWVNSVDAQGTILFTWHGDSNFFQASFQVYYDEIQPGTNFSSALFLDSLSAITPTGQTYHGGDSSSDGHGSFIPWNLSVQMNDFQRSTELLMVGGNLFGSPYRTAGVIWEQSMSGSPIFRSEPGYWTAVQIPEPSIAGIAIFGVGIFASKRYLSKKSRFSAVFRGK